MPAIPVEKKDNFSQNCMKERKEYLGNFLIVEVEFDPQETKGLIGIKKSRKRKRMCPQNNPISAKKDKSHITCFECKNTGHYANDCPEKKQRTKGTYGRTMKPGELSEVNFFHGDAAGHYAIDCPDPKKAGAE